MNLKIFHVEEINTHGGSIRVYVKKNSNKNIKVKNSVITIFKKRINLKFRAQLLSRLSIRKLRIKENTLLKKLVDYI